MLSSPAEAPPTVLWVDDDPDVLLSAQFAVRPLAARLLTARDPREALVVLGAQQVDAIVLDMNFSRGASSGAEGLGCLEALRALDPDAAVVVATAYADVELAVAAMQRGAVDFITKPWTEPRLVATLRTACRLRRARREITEQGARVALLSGGDAGDGAALLGNSAAMRRVRDLITLAAPTDASVLLLGENGTGKELAARLLHRRSARADRAFVTVDLGAVSGSVFDSELFGHRRGAFTDAKSDRIGRLQAADRGTLFLDEIGNLPLALQPKLLTVLEQRRVTPLGSNAEVRLDLRVVAATNLDRSRLHDEAVFRRDLLYRLNTLEIELPPLRERPEDIVPLALHYLRHYEQRYQKPNRALSDAAGRALEADPWPGNVRALRHAAERAVILCMADGYRAEDFALAANPAPLSRRSAPSARLPEPDDLNIERSERALIERALRKHQWRVAQAARELGLSRAALYRRMERYGL